MKLKIHTESIKLIYIYISGYKVNIRQGLEDIISTPPHRATLVCKVLLSPAAYLKHAPSRLLSKATGGRYRAEIPPETSISVHSNTHRIKTLIRTAVLIECHSLREQISRESGIFRWFLSVHFFSVGGAVAPL